MIGYLFKLLFGRLAPALVLFVAIFLGRDRGTATINATTAKSMVKSLAKVLCFRLLPAMILFVVVFIGWCNLDPRYPWEARFFKTVIPLFQGYLPPNLFGDGNLGAKMTPPVPQDMLPRPRPEQELFATLVGSGDSMPMAGIGMCCRPTAYDDICVERTIEWYLLLGGRHIDTAHLYLNHEPIGKGIANAINKGIPRNEIFLTTKIYPALFGYDSTREVVLSSLKELNQEYLDMVLLHAPSRMLPGPNAAGCKGLTNKECRQETWRALSDLRNEGKIRNAGVSNFIVHHLKDILELNDDNDSSSAVAPISNNQIPWNPWAPVEYVETVEFCKSKNIQITGYNSLGGSTMESEKAKQLKTLQVLSEKHGRSIQQIMLRWALQSGVAIIPGTGNPKYMEENLTVYNFELSEADMTSINALREELAGQFMTIMPKDD